MDKTKTIYQETEDTYIRQQDFLSLSQAKSHPIAIVGAGGIGSWTSFILAKLGCRDLTIYDFDVVQLHNLPSQLYRPQDIGKFKAEATAKNIELMTGYRPYFQTKKMEASFPNDIVVIGVDSMEERWKINDLNLNFYSLIDARMGAEQLELYVCGNNDIWRNTLVPIGTADQDPCTGRSVVYNTSVIGGLVGSVVKKLLRGENSPHKLIFDLKTYMLVRV